jgi:hypothetical protein
MKKMIVAGLFSGLFAFPSAQAADVGFNLNVNVGNRPPAVQAAPVYVNPPVVIEEPPQFIMPPALGFYVAAAVPYDMVLVGNVYFLHKGNAWYRAPHYNGPWVAAPYRSLPPGLRKHRFEKIRHYRDMEYERFHGDEAHYQGKHFRPEKEWKERRKEEHERWKEEKKREKEERKHDRHGGH